MKVSDLLNQLKRYIAPNPEAIQAEIYAEIRATQRAKKSFYFKLIGGCVSIFLIVTGISFYLWNYFTFDSSTNITGDVANLSPIVYVAPKYEKNNAALTNASINIVTKNSMSVKEVEKCISFTPEASYTIKKKGINRFELNLNDQLKSNTSYTLSSKIENKTIYRWSLQTESPFQITNAYPVGEHEIDINTAIEVSFSESGVNAFEEYFNIVPKVPGTFKHNGRNWLFLPSEPLQPYTVYTVSISSDIANTDGETLNEDYVFSFTTGPSDDKWAYVDNNTFDIADIFSTNTVPYVSVYAKGMTSATADITIYKLPDSQSYQDLHSKYNKDAIISANIINDVNALQCPIQSQFSVSAIKSPDNDQLYYFNYPKEMEAGYYVTQINWNGIKLYQLLQINDLIVYAAAHDGSYVVWVNNAQTALPADNVVVKIGDQTEKTDQNGIATIKKTDDDAESTYISISADTILPYILHAQNSTDETPNAISDYYTFLYTNSTIYHENDTLKVWGTVIKRFQNSKEPTVTLYAHWNDTEYAVKLDSNGAFNFEIPIKNYKLDQYSELALRINGYDCNSKYFAVVDYELPAYSLSMQADKNAYFAGNEIHYNINASYFDGTPVGNLSLNDNNNATLVTDHLGTAQYSKAAKIDPEVYEYTLSSCKPQINWQYFETNSSIGATAFAETPTLVFENNEFLGAELKKETNGYTIDIKTNKITLDKINQMSASEFSDIYEDTPTEYFLGDAVDKKITLEIHEITYDRNKIDSYYDPIQKKLQFKYEYIPKDSVIKSDTFTTKDGLATLENYVIPSSEGIRYLKLSMKDAAGKNCFVTIYIDHQVEEDRDQYEFSGIDHNADKNEKLLFNVYDPNTKQKLIGSFVYLVVGDDYFKAGISESGSASFVFDEKCLPDVTLFGAYFDGKFLHPVTPHNITADISEKKLNIQIVSDKKEYAPGDTVTLDVVTTNPEGAPVNASFNINVMDQALLTIADNNGDILSELYSPRAPMDIYSSLYIQQYGEGGGGGESTRSDFEDTPAFINGQTGADGKAKVSFNLPDSLTRWTISARAITKNAAANDTQIEIVCTKDMFISAKAPVGAKPLDDIVIPYRCDGSKISKDSTINITATLLKDEAVIGTQNAQYDATKLQYFNFGKLKEGSYSIQIDATSKTATDSIKIPFEIVSSNLTVNTISQLNEQSDSVSELILTDIQYEQYTKLLNQLLISGSRRIDHAIAEQYALAISEHFDPLAYTDVDWEFLNDFCINGGYAPYVASGESDLFLTARIASLFPEEIDKEFALWYFNGILSNKDATLEDILCALWGKASLHEAVEKDLAYYYGEGNTLSTEQQLYIALAYAYSGNHTAANEIYLKHIQPKLIRNSSGAYLEDKDPYIMDRCNSMLSFLTSRISSKDADAILSYLQQNDSETVLLSLEIIAYLLDYTPNLEGKNSAKITFANGDETIVEYPKIAPFTFKMNPEDSVGLTVESLQGESIVRFNSSTSSTFIQKNGKKIGAIPCYIPQVVNLGDDMPINISVNTDQLKSNKINIVFPSGIRYLQKYIATNDNVFIEASKDSRFLTITTADVGNVDITLYCKAALPGSFVFEPMICVEDENLNYLATDPCEITIVDILNPIEEISDEEVADEETSDEQPPYEEITPNEP